MNRTTEKQRATCARGGPSPTGAARATTASAGEPSEDRAGALSGLMESWIGGEGTAEQRDTMLHLIRALDDNRLSYRKLFPQQLKGKSW